MTGDWFTMHSNGAPIWIKPPLYFWLEAGIFSLFGASEYAARFPSALCGYLCAILIYLLTRRLFGRRTAFLAILVTATSFLFIKYSRRAMIDVPVAFATTLGAYALVRAEKRSPFFLLYGLAIALGYYFKAIQGLYLALIGPTYLLVSGQWRRLASPWFLAANAGAAGLIALWAVPQALDERRRLPAFAIRARAAAQPRVDRRARTSVRAVPVALPDLLAVGAAVGCRADRSRPQTAGVPRDAAPVLLVLRDHGGSVHLTELLPALPPSGRPRPDHCRGLRVERTAEPALVLARLSTRRRRGRNRRHPSPDAAGAARQPGHRPDRCLSDHAAPHEASDQIVLFKGNHWTVGQGLSFYADRRLARHFDDAGEIARFLDSTRTGVYGIANAADYEELRGRAGRRRWSSAPGRTGTSSSRRPPPGEPQAPRLPWLNSLHERERRGEL